MSKSNVHRILKDFNEESRVQRKPHNKGRTKTIEEATKNEIIALQLEHPNMTLKTIRQKIQETIPTAKVPSKSSIHRIIKDANFTTKLLKPIPIGRNTKTNIQARKEYSMWATGIPCLILFVVGIYCKLEQILMKTIGYLWMNLDSIFISIASAGEASLDHQQLLKRQIHVVAISPFVQHLVQLVDSSTLRSRPGRSTPANM